MFCIAYCPSLYMVSIILYLPAILLIACVYSNIFPLGFLRLDIICVFDFCFVPFFIVTFWIFSLVVVMSSQCHYCLVPFRFYFLCPCPSFYPFHQKTCRCCCCHFPGCLLEILLCHFCCYCFRCCSSVGCTW